MKFEYDPNKSKSNQQKHGITLEDARGLWLVSNVVIPARTLDEPRFMIIGKIDNNFYSCIYTIRDPNIVRLISARRSRKSEEVIYYEHIKA